jgi:hypothetical protein
MGIELTQQNHNYSKIDDNYETNERCICVIDTSTVKGKILCCLSCIVGGIIIAGVVVGLAFFFAIL